jgi:predicted metalloprotease with PDZ domain
VLRSNLKGFGNKPGRLHQSLAESSYETWSDGPFGGTGDRADKTISYYQKGPIVTWMFDLAVRHATANKKSFDDVMRTLYRKYYQEKKRGFTEAELKQEIETVAGTKLPELFDYIYTTKEMDYNKYLGYAGLRVDPSKDFEISKVENPSAMQQQIYNSWTGR